MGVNLRRRRQPLHIPQLPAPARRDGCVLVSNWGRDGCVLVSNAGRDVVLEHPDLVKGSGFSVYGLRKILQDASPLRTGSRRPPAGASLSPIWARGRPL